MRDVPMTFSAERGVEVYLCCSHRHARWCHLNHIEASPNSKERFVHNGSATKSKRARRQLEQDDAARFDQNGGCPAGAANDDLARAA
jgi:hypothetical protein